MIALFFPALISISIYARRRHIKLDLDVRLWIRYAVYVVAVNWCNMSLTTYVFGIDDSKFEIMAKKAVRFGGLSQAYVPLTEEDVVNILRMCL